MKLCVLFKYVVVIVFPRRLLFVLHWIFILFLVVMLFFWI
jgi:hypothetical protein